MGSKTITRTEVEKEIVDGEFHYEEVEKEVTLDVCDMCDVDERALNDEFRVITSLPPAESLADEEIRDMVDDTLQNIAVRVTMSTADGMGTQVIAEKSLFTVAENDLTAASTLPSDVGSYSLEVSVGPLPDEGDGEPEKTGVALLLCPHCHKGLFGEDA